jgi:hypothetical protein
MRAISKCVAGAGFATLAVLAGADAARSARQMPDFDWQTFTIPDFGTRVEYPAGVFDISEGKSEKGVGERFSTSDGRALLTIYSRANAAGDTPASYLKANLRQPRSSLDYERITSTFFAISSVSQGLVYYSRCNFSAGGDPALHCFDMVYPQREQRAWDAIVTRISRTLRPLARGE